MVFAYSVDVWPEEVKIEGVYSANVIQENGDLKSDMWMIFRIPNNFSSNITISFDPWERMDNEPIKLNSIIICDSYSGGWNYDYGYDETCETPYDYTPDNYVSQRPFIFNGKVDIKNYSEYSFTFKPENITVWKQFVFKVEYTVPHFIFKQGDYYVARMSYPNMQNKDFEIVNSVVLPTKDDVPRFIPDAKKIERVSYKKDGVFYRWVFVFEGADEKNIWYSNDAEMKKIERNNQWFYFGISVLSGLVFAILLIFFERWFFDWTSMGNNCIKKLVIKFGSDRVVGNVSGKKYHKPDCPFVDNITRKNWKSFKNKKEAEKNRYSQCRICK
ncbi:MAG: hypothetical protein ACP5NV_02480 [Candidatus Woesearchaeota archaeon]